MIGTRRLVGGPTTSLFNRQINYERVTLILSGLDNIKILFTDVAKFLQINNHTCPLDVSNDGQESINVAIKDINRTHL
jgi:hypothetical protein